MWDRPDILNGLASALFAAAFAARRVRDGALRHAAAGVSVA